MRRALRRLGRAGVRLLLAAHLLARVAHATDEGDLASLDLTHGDGVAAVQGEWRFADARIIDVAHRAPDADGQPTGAKRRTQSLEPRAGAAGFDDARLQPIAPESLAQRRGNGRLSFGWYVLRFVVPEQIAGVSVAGRTLLFETTVDDYAEIWVDGALPRALGQRGGSVVAGWNAPNRVVLRREARPGDAVRVAVFAGNGPLSDPPANFLWMRSARLLLREPEARGPIAIPPREVNVEVRRESDGLDAVVPANPKLHEIAEGFRFTEGPVWSGEENALLFSDPNENRIWRWSAEQGLSVFRERSGHDEAHPAGLAQPGSNGLALDPSGRLTICEHGRRRVVRLERDGGVTVLAERFEGARLDSPNDLVWRSDGTLFFSDPPFGLPMQHDDPRRETPFAGVYAWRDGVLRLLVRDLAGPNGIALSPDERVLYVGNWDPARKVVMRFDLDARGAVSNGRVFADLGREPGEDAIDGIEVDADGRVYVSGPGAIWIFAPDGERLGAIVTPKHVHNMAFGDADGRTLYLAARSSLYRLRLNVAGAQRAPAPPGSIVRGDPALDAIVPPGTRFERVASGFGWTEGPLWDARAGELLFSDVQGNAIRAWRSDGSVRRVVERSGWTGEGAFAGREPGSNGLAFDREGRLVAAQHGDRRVVRFERDGTRTPILERVDGRRLSSPNDLLVDARGALWLTDPPFGLPRGAGDPAREIARTQVLRRDADGRVHVITDRFPFANGLALAPDARTLFVSSADPVHPAWWEIPIAAGGSAGEPRLFADGAALRRFGPGSADGMKLGPGGALFAAGPGGVHVFSRDGRWLGALLTRTATSNVALGEDGRTLFVTASDAIWRARLAPEDAIARQ